MTQRSNRKRTHREPGELGTGGKRYGKWTAEGAWNGSLLLITRRRDARVTGRGVCRHPTEVGNSWIANQGGTADGQSVLDYAV